MQKCCGINVPPGHRAPTSLDLTWKTFPSGKSTFLRKLFTYINVEMERVVLYTYLHFPFSFNFPFHFRFLSFQFPYLFPLLTPLFLSSLFLSVHSKVGTGSCDQENPYKRTISWEPLDKNRPPPSLSVSLSCAISVCRYEGYLSSHWVVPPFHSQPPSSLDLSLHGAFQCAYSMINCMFVLYIHRANPPPSLYHRPTVPILKTSRDGEDEVWLIGWEGKTLPRDLIQILTVTS